MPYISKERKETLIFDAGRDAYPTNYLGTMAHSAGELNFIFSDIIREYLDNLNHPARYQDYNDIVGALECCKQEFYRRVVVPYEEKKIAENGDVY